MSGPFSMSPSILAPRVCDAILDGRVEALAEQAGNRSRVTITLRQILVEVVLSLVGRVASPQALAARFPKPPGGTVSHWMT